MREFFKKSTLSDSSRINYEPTVARMLIFLSSVPAVMNQLRVTMCWRHQKSCIKMKAHRQYYHHLFRLHGNNNIYFTKELAEYSQ